LTSIGDLSVDLRLATAKFSQGVNTANKHLSSLERSAASVNKVFGGLLAAGGGIAFSALIKNSLDAANRLNDLNVRLGVSVEGLSRLEYAAKLSGVGAKTLETGLQRMTRRISEAASGSGEAVNALDELGLSAEKLSKVRPDEQFEVLADALEKVPAQGDKVRLAMKLLDSEGVSLLQTMKGGSAAIREMGKESDRTGNTISSEFAASATQANAAMVKLQASGVGLTNSLTVALGPTIAEVAEWLAVTTPAAANAARDSFKLLSAGVLESVNLMLAPLEGLYDVLEELPGSLGETYASAKQSIQDIRQNLTGGADLIFESVHQAEVGQKGFNVTLGNSVVSIEQFVGSTKSATNALQNQKAAAKSAADAEKARQDIITNFEKIRTDNLPEEESENEKYLSRIARFQEFAALSAEFEAEANSAAEIEHLRHQQSITDIEKAETDKRIRMSDIERRQKVAVMSGMFGNLSSLMNTESKKLFKIGKAAAIANALVSGYEAVVHSYKAGAQIGGPPLGAAFATTAAIATAVQIQQIKSQKFGGGGTVSAGTSGGAGPGVYQPPQPQIPTSSESQGQTIQFVFNGDLNGVDPEQLGEVLKDHIENTDFVLIESATRNGQILAGS